jgi:hypothetical protein
MGFLRQIGEYLYIVKRNPKQERTGMMKAMHGMNRISLIVFLISLIRSLISNFCSIVIFSSRFFNFSSSSFFSVFKSGQCSYFIQILD